MQWSKGRQVISDDAHVVGLAQTTAAMIPTRLRPVQCCVQEGMHGIARLPLFFPLFPLLFPLLNPGSFRHHMLARAADRAAQ